ncbi:MAG TPA: GNAT family N-acetyltransferase [Candidatus Omnitrophota bacterium]|nr:GNAT family N-acetyltransferase [Candidatus Omnitrophota bacterium]HPS19971.1 GNAT family N-acetyltransferase [Candidatus Omnitrophota bacterium]
MKISRRHKRTPFRTIVTRKISDIPKEHWNAVYPNVLEGYDFFRTLDESNIDQFAFYYIIVYEQKKPVGAAPCFLLDYSLDTSINGPLRRISNAICKVMPRIFSIRAFVCGMPIGQGQIGIAHDADKVVKVIMRRMEQMAKKNRASVIAFKDFDQAACAVLDPIQKEGFKKIEGLPTTILNVWFKDFEEYLNTLSGGNRYDLRRKFKKVDGKVKIDFEEVVRLEGEALKDVYKLYLDIVERHDMRFELLPIDFFINISKNMPQNSRYFLWRIDGKLVTFLFCFISKDLFLDYYVGLDYSVAHKYHLYFVKFRDMINWCIKHKIPKYEMGFTGYEPKRRLGFDFVPFYFYVKLRNSMLRPVFDLLCNFLKFENFDPVLKEVKKERRHAK